jgi:ATP-binding cassette, subfamily C (CFTR/MRP), member 1
LTCSLFSTLRTPTKKNEAVSFVIAALALALGAIYASIEMHTNLLVYVIHWPMALFDVTPIGRVLNRFAKDVDVVDNTLPMLIRSWISSFFSVIEHTHT